MNKESENVIQILCEAIDRYQGDYLNSITKSVLLIAYRYDKVLNLEYLPENEKTFSDYCERVTNVGLILNHMVRDLEQDQFKIEKNTIILNPEVQRNLLKYFTVIKEVFDNVFHPYNSKIRKEYFNEDYSFYK